MQGKTDPTTPTPDHLLNAIRGLYGDCNCSSTYTCRGCEYLTSIERAPLPALFLSFQTELCLTDERTQSVETLAFLDADWLDLDPIDITPPVSSAARRFIERRFRSVA